MSSAKYRDGYDPLGNLAALTDENGHVTQNGYDLLSQPVTKLLPDGSLTESRTYDAAGNLTALRHFNGKTTTYTYDPLNRLIARVPDPSLRGGSEKLNTEEGGGSRLIWPKMA